ncbi:HAD-IIIC family phosphatase [Streptomyces sp. TG1A-8]|uniref:HAD-IIIC family phosphatase n=1 Tax=Streptomyces sp. TG1A-8 TaxID=3051385 RepID=UPI00265C4657|nr:HAD-IIIC family phosphatase [Streptomyces sp. TG1A-8]MDO0924004.1 HAD-IIIC family phosphatase [Streptomyces sp. TG1A-8]
MTERPTTVKCLVWDLDNTLWQGTLLDGDDVRITDEAKHVITELDRRGILQAVCSKNDHDLAWERLERLGVAEYFVLPHIGWGPKSESVRSIAERLNFAHGTMAFVDDTPAERAEVSYHLPEVRCYDAEQLSALLDLPEFSPVSATVDSRRRREMYQAGFRRDAEREAYKGPDDDFLRSLDLWMSIDRATEDELTRVEELTLRTSQMNATGVHYDDASLRRLMADLEHEVLVVTMGDRFGPHGAVGLVLLHRTAVAWHLKLLATSCRVVSFGAGAAILNWLVDQAAASGVHLIADFRATARNRMMEIAYRFAGFEDQPCECHEALTEAADGTPGVQRLHLVPGRRPAPATMRLDAVALTKAETPVSL